MMPSGMGLGASMTRQQVNVAGSVPETASHKKLAKAAQEFEGMLISQLLGNFTSGFSSISADAPLAGSDTLNSLAVQTLSTAMASRGGFGMAKMLVHQLEPSVNHAGAGKPGDRRNVIQVYLSVSRQGGVSGARPMVSH